FGVIIHKVFVDVSFLGFRRHHRVEHFWVLAVPQAVSGSYRKEECAQNYGEPPDAVQRIWQFDGEEVFDIACFRTGGGRQFGAGSSNDQGELLSMRAVWILRLDGGQLC